VDRGEGNIDDQALEPGGRDGVEVGATKRCFMHWDSSREGEGAVGVRPVSF